MLVGQAVSPGGFRLAWTMLEYKRKLPHFHPDDVYIFLTWRLWKSLPSYCTGLPGAMAGRAFVMNDRLLDRDTLGPVWLRHPEIARMVAETLQAGDVERHFYELGAWVVMPNHVHVLMLPRTGLPIITRWLKGSTARQANRLLARTGQPFWQDESYDHWVRNEKQLIRIINYIEQNPVTAGLAECAELWPWSSAGWQAKPPTPPRQPSPTLGRSFNSSQ